jgi:hypothetical protein
VSYVVSAIVKYVCFDLDRNEVFYFMIKKPHFSPCSFVVTTTIRQNSEATKAGLDKECEIEMASPECVDYGQFLEQLNVIRSSLDHFENKKRTLKDALKSIQITAGASSKAKSSPKLTEALEAAKKATAEFGVTSVEARLAWEDYEEIASSGLDNAMGVSLADECSLESGQAACQAIEEMDRVMAVLLAVSESK